MMKKIIYTIIVSMLTIGCISHYGTFVNGKYDYRSDLQVNQDSTFIYELHRHWWQWNSFGTWTSVPNKKNHILLKSSLEDYTRIPIDIVESKNEDSRQMLIFTQGVKHYDCDRKEIFINGQAQTIDKDTILLSSNHIDSIMICLGFYDREQIMFFSPHYDSICSQIYYPLDSANNVFTITIPEFPSITILTNFMRQKRKASMLFLYVPMETEAFYKNGKWYLYGKDGNLIPYKRPKESKKRM